MRLVTINVCGTRREYAWVDRALVPLEELEVCLIQRAFSKIIEWERRRMCHELILYGQTSSPSL